MAICRNSIVFRIKFHCSQCHSLNHYLHTDPKIQSTDFKPIQLKEKHLYKNLFPWKNAGEFSEYLKTSIIYNEGGLIALNKPFGIKIHSHDSPGTRSKTGNHTVVSSTPECDYTIHDALPSLREHLNSPNLSIIKSAEKFTSGIVLLSATEKVTKAVSDSFLQARLQQKPHLSHWMITLGCPVVCSRSEKVGIKFLEAENVSFKQPVIVDKFSIREAKSRKVHPVTVEYRMLSSSKPFQASLVEIKSSSVKYHFVRVYAASRIAPILGDIMYGSRVQTLLGMPINVHIQQASAYNMQPLPDTMCQKLLLPKGVRGHSTVPTMLHFRNILLPSFQKKDDVSITADPPPHFRWTAENLNLL